jgi:hypothetical protein
MLPETIDASIDLDGYRYRMAVKARVVATEALRVLAKGGELTAAMETSLRAEEARALKEPGYTQFTYQGKGRYDAATEITGELTRPGASIGFPFTRADRKADNFLIIGRLPDGTIEVASATIPDGVKQSLTRAGITPSGTVEIKVTGRVLDSNATEPPKSPGEPYRWKITSWNDFVFLKVAAP